MTFDYHLTTFEGALLWGLLIVLSAVACSLIWITLSIAQKAVTWGMLMFCVVFAFWAIF